MRQLWLIAFCIAALAVGLSAGAATTGHPHGRPSGIVPPSPGATAALNRTQAYGSGDLMYGGGRVMRTITNYAIYWVPSGYSFGNSNANYENTINQYFRDVAADSGTGSNVYSTDTQYYDTSGHIAYSSSFGGSYVDTNAFPSSHGCVDRNDSTCINDSYVQSEIHRVVLANNWPQDGNSQYFLFTPKNVGECIDTSSTECAYSTFCAYHWYIPSSGTQQMIYAYQPWTSHWAGGACDVGQYPNGSDADPTINVMSHENNEAITDPDTASGWIDAAGYENGDKCAWIFGSVMGSTGAFYNQTINGHHYFLQEEYSNAGHNCVQSLPTVPVNHAAPTISGTATVGQILTANAGTWSSSPTKYTYAWLRCDSGGANCSTITSASSSSTSTTFQLATVDAGHTIRISVTAKNGAGSSNPATSPPTGVVSGPQVPTNTSAPSISGTVTVGQTLTAAAGSWTGSPTQYAYAWQRCDSSGANCSTFTTKNNSSTSTSYKLVTADLGHTIRVSVTAKNGVGSSSPATTAQTSVVTGPGAPSNITAPTISGTATVGQKLTASAGSWTGSPTQYTYAWQRCDSNGSNCSTATTKSGGATIGYKLTNADVGHTIRVTVTASNSAGTSDARQSAATSLVA